MGVGLLQKVSVEGDGNENSDTITETWLADWSDISGGYNLSYPQIGVAWSQNSDFICSTIKWNKDNKFFYGYDINGNLRNGIETVMVQATFKKDYVAEESPWQIKIGAAGFRTFKKTGGGTWGVIQKPCGWQEWEYKLPVLQYDVSSFFIGNLPFSLYYSYVGKINSVAMPFFGISERGTVLFESFSIIPNLQADGITVNYYDVTLTFKYSMFDWNWEWRNPVQLTNMYDGKPMIWQNKYPNRPDYTQDASKVNLPIWSGEISVQGEGGQTSTIGDPAYGTGGWDWRYNQGTTDTIYKYADLNDLFEEETGQ